MTGFPRSFSVSVKLQQFFGQLSPDEGKQIINLIADNPDQTLQSKIIDGTDNGGSCKYDQSCQQCPDDYQTISQIIVDVYEDIRSVYITDDIVFMGYVYEQGKAGDIIDKGIFKMNMPEQIKCTYGEKNNKWASGVVKAQYSA